MGFELVQGNFIENTEGLRDSYEVSTENDGCIEALLSAPKLLRFINDFVALIKEPIFFFVEIPCDENEEKESGGEQTHYRLYYLDNCTLPVIKAVLKTYGSLLVNDGLCRFGFGGNESGDEIYIKKFKVIGLYCSNDKVKNGTIRLLEKYGAEKSDKLLTPWELLSNENPGYSSRVDDEDISIYDLPELLKDAGMYFSEIVG